MTIQRGRGFVPNHAEFGMHIRSEVARKPALLIAAKIAALANATAPVQGETAKESRQRKAQAPVKGGYKSGPDGNLSVGRNTRAIAVVFNKTPNAMAGEVATGPGKKNPRTLFNAAVTVSIAELGTFDGYGKSGRLGA